MKQIFFYGISANPKPGGSDPLTAESAAIRDQLIASALLVAGAANDRRFDRGFCTHNTEHRAVPLALIDIDGTVYEEFPAQGYDHNALLAAWDNAPDTIQPPPAPPKPQARILTKNALGQAETVFSVGDPITIIAEILDPTGASIVEDFVGTFPVPFFDSNGREYWIKLTFEAGVAEVTVGGGVLPTGKYMATEKSSVLADVIPHTIIVALSGDL